MAKKSGPKTPTNKTKPIITKINTVNIVYDLILYFDGSTNVSDTLLIIIYLYFIYSN
jgi:hypothetical protein